MKFMSVALVILLNFLVTECSESEITVNEGDDAVLLCVYPHTDLPKNPTVIWKDPEDQVLLKLVGGGVENTHRDVRLDSKNEGNFSICITKVILDDSGRYECHIRDVNVQKNIYLTVNEIKKTGQSHLEGHAVVPVLSACVFMLVILNLFL